jgi:hypothetical protein
MAYWHMTRKVARHPTIDPDETVLHAAYGLGASFVRFANSSATGLNAVQRGRPSLFQEELWSADYDGSEGLAQPLQCNGVVAVTDRRVIFFKKATVVGRPKHIAGVWSHDQVEGAEYDATDKVLRLRFVDGSSGGLHVPGNQKPQRILDAIDTCSQDRSSEA